MSGKTQYHQFTTHDDKDKDILDCLVGSENKSATIRRLLRAGIAAESKPNPWLPREYERKLLEIPDLERRKLLEGQWVNEAEDSAHEVTYEPIDEPEEKPHQPVNFHPAPKSGKKRK